MSTSQSNQRNITSIPVPPTSTVLRRSQRGKGVPVSLTKSHGQFSSTGTVCDNSGSISTSTHPPKNKKVSSERVHKNARKSASLGYGVVQKNGNASTSTSTSTSMSRGYDSSVTTSEDIEDVAVVNAVGTTTSASAGETVTSGMIPIVAASVPISARMPYFGYPLHRRPLKGLRVPTMIQRRRSRGVSVSMSMSASVSFGRI